MYNAEVSDPHHSHATGMWALCQMPYRLLCCNDCTDEKPKLGFIHKPRISCHEYGMRTVGNMWVSDAILKPANIPVKIEKYPFIFVPVSITWTGLQTISIHPAWIALINGRHNGTSVNTYRKLYGMWQFTSDGSIHGYNGRMDLDYAYKDYPKPLWRKKDWTAMARHPISRSRIQTESVKRIEV